MLSRSGTAANLAIDSTTNVSSKQKKRVHHRDATIENARKALVEDLNLENVALIMKGIGSLLDFVTLNKPKLDGRSEEVRKLELLTSELLSTIPNDSVLHSILKEVGWGGARYQFNADVTVDTESLFQILSSIYLSKAQVEYTDDKSVLKSFSPDALISCHEDNLLSIIKNG